MFTTDELRALCKLLVNTSLPHDDYPHLRSAIRKMEQELALRSLQADPLKVNQVKRRRRNV